MDYEEGVHDGGALGDGCEFKTGMGMGVRRDPSNGICSGGNGGDKAPKGQGEEAGSPSRV